MFYAGIGSRKTPENVHAYMERLAARLAARGFILRSGAAPGADTAFERGCIAAGGEAEIWLPWKGFNQHADTGLYPSDFHFDQASRYHPQWSGLKHAIRCLHARNVGQVIGRDATDPSKFVVCWTPDGCESALERTKDTGGTGQAIALACGYNVPVFNLSRPDSRERLNALVLELIERRGPRQGC